MTHLFGDLTTTIGINSLKNKYSKNRHPTELNFNLENGETNQDNEAIGLGNLRKNALSSTFQPDGEQQFTTFYMDNSLYYGLFTLDMNVNLSKYRYRGEKFNYIPDEWDKLQDDYRQNSNLKPHIDKFIHQHCEISPDYDPLFSDLDDNEYEKYECREDNIVERVTGKRHYINYSAMLSMNVNDLFNPFISYAKNHRAPNIKEMFFSNQGNHGVNAELKAEKASTYQLGFNSFKENFLAENDFLGIKATAYRTEINNYIFNYGKTLRLNEGLGVAIRHRNQAHQVVNKGIELELNYDIGQWYTNITYAYQRTNQPISYTDASSEVTSINDHEIANQGFGASKVSILPRYYGSIELGARLLDKKITMGALAKYYGTSKRASTIAFTQRVNNDEKRIERFRQSETVPKQPMIFDIYLTYQPIKALTLKAEVQNVFDKRYIDPLDSNNDSASQSYFLIDLGAEDKSVFNNFARGRTLLFSVNYQF